MIECPNCGAKLPPRARLCTFCQSGVDPDLMDVNRKHGFGPAKWVVYAYYAISIYFMFSGASSAIQTAYKFANPDKHFFALFGVISLIFSAFTFFLGLGLALRIEFVRGIANFMCGIQIILGLLSAPSVVLVSFALGPFGVLLMLMRALDIATAAMMIFLIGETDHM